MRVIFFGTPDFSALTLKELINVSGIEVGCVVTQPDRPQGRGNELTPSPIKKLASSHHIPVIQPENIRKNEEDFIQAVREFGPYDIGVVIAFGQILSQKVLDLPKNGCVNIHASLLPRWRGAAPIQRAIMAGDKETGIALMKMELGLDTGPVYCTEKVAIEDFDTFEILHDRLSHVGAKLLAENIRRIASGLLAPQLQPNDGITYAHKIENEETQIDWSKSSVQINNLIRALNPVPGAFTIASGKRLKIFEAQPVRSLKTGNFNPGQIVAVDSTKLEIQCGEGILALLQVQLEGKKKMSTTEFIRGFPLSLNDTLVTGGAH